MLIWIIFGGIFLLLIALDLGVFHREAHVPSTREALGWTSIWVLCALFFAVFVFFAYRDGLAPNPNKLTAGEAVLKYLTGYVIEQSLSLDNIFVIALIFQYFQIPIKNQHRVLFWGILGALFFRGLLIGMGVYLINQYSWIIYVFGGLLLYSAFKLMRSGDKPIDLKNNQIIKMLKKILPISTGLVGSQFFIRRMNVFAITPLFLALIMVEVTDVMFALDSVPAIFAITTDPFLVFTSNIFALLGLRSLYFVLASMLDKFLYLKPALVFILFFVGVKMLLSHLIEIPEWISLLIIAGSLTIGVVASLKIRPNSTT